MSEHRPVLVVEVHGEERCARFYELMKAYGYRCETAAGAVIADGAYHHQVVCLPGENLLPRLEHLGGLKREEIDMGVGPRGAEIAGPV